MNKRATPKRATPRRLLDILLVLVILGPIALYLWADTETLMPDGVVIDAGYSGAATDIDDDPDSIDANLLTIANNTEGQVRVQFPTPTDNPTTGTDVQCFRIAISETTTNNGNADEQYIVHLYENGTQRQADLTNVTGDVTDDPGTTVFDSCWDASNLTTPDGSTVEAYINTFPEQAGKAADRGSIQVEAVEWNVDYTVGGNTSLSRRRRHQ